MDIDLLFSPAGLLCEKIQKEVEQPVAHLFASANTQHPQTLVNKGLAKSHVVFAKNRLCMTVCNQPQWTNRDWLTILLDSKTRIGMSTPQKDPSGDYVFSLFDGIEAQYSGQGITLKQRAMQLVGGELTSATTSIRPAEHFLLNGIADVFIGYANYSINIKQNPLLTVIELPNTLYSPIDYNVALLNRPHPYAQQFIDFILSEKGQHCLTEYGFIAMT